MKCVSSCGIEILSQALWIFEFDFVSYFEHAKAIVSFPNTVQEGVEEKNYSVIFDSVGGFMLLRFKDGELNSWKGRPQILLVLQSVLVAQLLLTVILLCIRDYFLRNLFLTECALKT